MATRALSRSRASILSSVISQAMHRTTVVVDQPLAAEPKLAAAEMGWWKPLGGGFGSRMYHDGRPRGPLWRGKKLLGKEALFVIQGLKRFKDDQHKLDLFFKGHVRRLLKLDLVCVLNELERQHEVDLAVKIFEVIRKQDWYKPDVYLYKDLLVTLSRAKKMDQVTILWLQMKEDKLFPDSQTYSQVMRGFLSAGSPGDAMNIYEDMKLSPDPPEEFPFRMMLKSLIPFPLLRNRVKQDFEELFPENRMYDPPEEIFGAC